MNILKDAENTISSKTPITKSSSTSTPQPSSGSSSFFQKAASNPSSLGKDFVGPNYIYSKWIKSPSEMGMTDGASLSDFANNVSGLMNYVTILTEGGGPASKVDGKNLGDRYFLSTGANCTDSKGNSVKRSLFIDNIANGNDPALKEMGLGDSALNGLIPGLLNDAIKMNPAAIFGAFMQGSNPQCTNIHMKTIDANNVEGTGSGFVVNSEIKEINPCAFVSGKNPLTGDSCPTKESFINANRKMQKLNKKQIHLKNLKNKPLANLYTAALGGLLIYIFYRLMRKN